MKVATLLNKHDESAVPEGLSNSLGDGYLIRNNSVFRTIRKKALELGFSYSDKISTDYQAFPMGQLEQILDTKTLPYVNNVEPLKNINRRASGLLEWDHVVDNLRPNYTFHESCHAVARSVSIQSQELPVTITAMLIEESFANTCEFLAIADAQDSTHRLFLEMNSYFTVFEDRTHLKKAIDKHGLKPVFQFMLLCYVHSNFLREDLAEADFKKITQLCDFDSEIDSRALKALAQNAFVLNPRFRYTTTEMYLRLKGIRTTVTEALSFDHLKLIQSDLKLKKLMNQLAEFIGNPL